MQSLQYTNTLENIGLSTEEAVVYELLLLLGEVPASSIAKTVPREYSLSRPLVYKLLDSLIDRGLVNKHEPKQGAATFAPIHPTAIRNVVEQQEVDLKRSKEQLANTLPELTSLYNLLSGKPGISFAEGKSGVEEALFATLQSNGPIYAYIDTDAVAEHAADINTAYVKQRLKKKIPKHILMMDSALAREKAKNADGELTDIRVVSARNMPSVPAVIEIYNNKVVYITFKDAIYTVTTITDDTLAKLHRFLFESHWDCARAFSGTENASSTK